MIQTDYKSMMKRSVDILVRFFTFMPDVEQKTHTQTHTHISASPLPRGVQQMEPAHQQDTRG